MARSSGSKSFRNELSLNACLNWVKALGKLKRKLAASVAFRPNWVRKLKSARHFLRSSGHGGQRNMGNTPLLSSAHRQQDMGMDEWKKLKENLGSSIPTAKVVYIPVNRVVTIMSSTLIQVGRHLGGSCDEIMSLALPYMVKHIT